MLKGTGSSCDVSQRFLRALAHDPDVKGRVRWIPDRNEWDRCSGIEG